MEEDCSWINHWIPVSRFKATPYEDDGCGEPGCFIDRISYTATKDQIEAIMKISTECTQSSFQYRVFFIYFLVEIRNQN